MSEKPAVPAFTNDPEMALAEVGRMYLYIKQLSDTLKERAIESNKLDDELHAARDELNEADDTIAHLRDEIETLSRDVFDLRATAIRFESALRDSEEEVVRLENGNESLRSGEAALKEQIWMLQHRG